MKSGRRTWAWILAVLAILGAFSAWLTNSKTQPVPFDHKKHVDFGMACDACHAGAKDSVKATIPNVQTCALCHVPGKASPRTPLSLERYVKEMKDISWQRVYEAPQHVRFSHKRHVEAAGLDCKACHGNIGMMEKPVVRQAVALTMENCRSCHMKEKVTTDCMACHR